MGEVFDSYQKKWFGEDGKFKGSEAVFDSLGNLKDDLNQVGDTFKKIAQDPQYQNLLGVQDAEREGMKGKGIATASQESVDELNGRATAIQGHTYSISENTKLLLQNTNNILRSVQVIEHNTERLHAMDKNIDEVKHTLSDIAIKGVRIKN